MTADSSRSPSATCRLKDGRTLSYAAWGDPSGTPLFYFHGFPGSRFEALLLAPHLQKHAVRLIAVDRPGIGASSPQKHRRLLDWPNDVLALADALHVARFRVFGFSGGGPYALACAHRIADRLDGCAVVATAAPVRDWRSIASQVLPWIMMPLIRRRFRDEARAEQTLNRLASRWPIADRQCLDAPLVRIALITSLMEAFNQGSAGPSVEAALLGRSWGFALEDVRFPIHLWHGERDAQIPISAGRAAAAALPKCQARYLPEEGHISLIANHGEEIIASLFA